jgi:hypothetical protein
VERRQKFITGKLKRKDRRPAKYGQLVVVMRRQATYNETHETTPQLPPDFGPVSAAGPLRSAPKTLKPMP